MTKKLISVIVPVFNEENNVRRTYSRLTDVLSAMSGRYDYEILFTDNHSTDRTFDILCEIGKLDERVRALRFTRNFGFQRSLLTGYRHAAGDAAIQIDCDLQDPPELIPAFVAEWEKGHDVIVGVRVRREEPRILTGLRRAFYRLLNAISEDYLPSDAGDFRLIDHGIIEQLRYIDETTPYVRGLTATLARNMKGIPFERNAREHDESKFPLIRLIPMALDGIFSHSILPLRVATIFGLFAGIITFLLIIYYLTQMFFFGAEWLTGMPTVLLLLLFAITLNALFLGVIGEYLGRVYNQIRKRPTTVVEEAINLKPRRWGGNRDDQMELN